MQLWGPDDETSRFGVMLPRGYRMLLTMNMILIQPSEMDEASCVVLTGERSRHIHHVLKATVGTSLRIGMLNGPQGTGTIRSMDGETVKLDCRFEALVSERPSVDLLLAMPRPKVLKRLWAQFSALGVDRIILVRAEKVERYYFDSHVVEPDFYTPLLIEGLQQARCTHLPEVIVKPLFKPFVEDELETLFHGCRKLLADPSGDLRLGALLQNCGHDERIVLAIGPEGGWTSYELEMLKQRGFELFGMGDRILRTDTATVGLLAMLADWAGSG